jgi:hypothetical protein
MGITLCRFHGESEIAFVCPHIEKLVDSGSKVKEFLELKVDLADAGVAVPYNFCPACAENYKLPLTTVVLSDSVSEDYEAAIDMTEPVCEICLAEVKIP